MRQDIVDQKLSRIAIDLQRACRQLDDRERERLISGAVLAMHRMGATGVEIRETIEHVDGFTVDASVEEVFGKLSDESEQTEGL